MGTPLSNLRKSDEVGFEAVIEIGGVVGNFVGQIDELRFEWRTLVEQIFGELGKLACRIVVGMLDDAFANFKSKIEAAKGGVA